MTAFDPKFPGDLLTESPRDTAEGLTTPRTSAGNDPLRRWLTPAAYDELVKSIVFAGMNAAAEERGPTPSATDAIVGTASLPRPPCEVICGERALYCICSLPPDHDGPHECARDGSQWLGSHGATSFEVVRFPDPTWTQRPKDDQ